MLKWLTITLIVLAGFMVILLGLGYLLNENEKTTTALKAQLEQASLAEKAKQQRRRQRAMLAEYPQAESQAKKQQKLINDAENKYVIEQFENIVISNLTCISVQQCQVAKVNFKNTKCTVAINNIGTSLLKKLNTQNSDIFSCPPVSPQMKLSCQQNICSVEN